MKNKKQKTEKVAFGVFRGQPSTNGHYSVWTRMARDNDIVIIGFGSTQAEISMRDPYNLKQRTEFFRTLFGFDSKTKFKIVPIRDIGAVNEADWVAHCMKQIEGKNLPQPTRYYAGSITDLHWFQGAVNLNGEKIELINLNRHDSGHLSGTFVRQSLANGTDEWRAHVPECIADLVEEYFPKELTLKYHQEKRLEQDNEH